MQKKNTLSNPAKIRTSITHAMCARNIVPYRTYQRVRRRREVAVHPAATAATAIVVAFIAVLLLLLLVMGAALVLQPQLHLELLHKEPFVEHIATSCQQTAGGAHAGAAVGIDYGAHYPGGVECTPPPAPTISARATRVRHNPQLVGSVRRRRRCRLCRRRRVCVMCVWL